MKKIYDTKTFRPGDGVGNLIGRVRKTMIEEIDEKLAPLDLSAAQWIVIMLIANGAASSGAELCKTITYDPGAMTRLLDRLETKGFLKRVRPGGDRRTVRIELTAEGRSLYPKIRAALVEVFNRLLRGFSKSEARQLEKFLERMLANA